MEHDLHHITPYRSHATILVILLTLTMTSVLVTQIHFSTFSVGVALIIASVKVSFVLIYFMHLKHESTIIKVMVAGVFSLYAIIVAITFIDYLLR
ncbi:MAG: cytochrome C oxidase subunit IV family protein [Bacteroidales bacterium]|nr:cytochrome C oxidase subunit IV family protein [Bacteroidales bacterium]